MGNSQARTSLSQEDVEYISCRTNYDSVAIKEWYNDFITEVPTGFFSKSTFVRGYQMFFPQHSGHGDTDQFCETLFKSFDQNKDGFIDFREFMVAIDVMGAGSTENKLKWAFNIYDIDMNGEIEMHEMTRIVKILVGVEEGEAAARADNIFRRMDINNDGKITLDEFLESCRRDGQLCDMMTQGAKQANQGKTSQGDKLKHFGQHEGLTRESEEKYK